MIKKIVDLIFVYLILIGVNKYLLGSLPLQKLSEAPLTVITVAGIIFAGIAMAVLLSEK